MSQFEEYDVSAWHDHGVVLHAPHRPRARVRRLRAASFAIALTITAPTFSAPASVERSAASVRSCVPIVGNREGNIYAIENTEYNQADADDLPDGYWERLASQYASWSTVPEEDDSPTPVV